MNRAIGLLLTLLLAAVALAANHRNEPKRIDALKRVLERVGGSGHQRIINRIAEEKADASYYNALYFTQKLDHFDHTNEDTWQQRYWANDEYFQTGGPIFMQIGGESGINSYYVSGLMMSEYAQQNNALQLALEHRFYGESMPKDDLSVDSLAYLSSQQALADLAFFLETYMEEQNIDPETKIIVFGGSYPGALAAWFKLKFPHVAFAAVASSPPIEAVLDFFQYLDVVGTSMATFTGEECDNAVRSATDTIQSMLQTDSGRKQLMSDFNICSDTDLTDADDVSTFMSFLMGMWMGTDQYNEELAGSTTVADLCNSVLDGATSSSSTEVFYENYVNMAQEAAYYYGGCLDANYNNSISYMLDTSTTSEYAATRSWIWQCCTEFAYWQTTDSTGSSSTSSVTWGGSSKNQPFGDLVPLSYYTQLCHQVYDGFQPAPDYVNQTNIYYGGNKIQTTNTLFVDGTIDPWHALSLLPDVVEDFTSTTAQSFGDGVVSLFIEGTAHCANMNPPSVYFDKPPPQMYEAWDTISGQISDWVNA